MPPTQTPTQTPALTRTVAKGNGPFVNEVYTDATGKVVRVNAFTADQLNAIKTNLPARYAQQQAQLEAQQAEQLKNVNDMLALLA